MQYLKIARFVNGYGEFNHSEIFLLVRVNQIDSGSCRDSLCITTVKVVGVSVVGFHQVN